MEVLVADKEVDGDAGVVDPEPSSHPSGGRRRGIRLALVGLVAIALVGGGFALGQTISNDDGFSNVVVAPGDASGTSGSGSSVISDPSGVGIISSGSVTIGGSGVLERVFVRSTGDGIELRAYLASSDVQTPQCASGTWCPGPDCFPTTLLQIEVSNHNAAAIWTTTADGSASAPVQVTDVVSLGVAEGDPATVVAVHASDQVTKVTLEFGGHADSMTPVNGWAVLAVPSSTASSLASGTITGYGDNGAQLGQASTTEQRSSFVPGPDCQPPPPAPPTLPEPDGAPPADQDAARAAVEDAYHQLFGGGSLESLEGGDQLQATIDQVTAKTPVPPGIGAAIHEIRFLDDHRAALIWDLLSANGPLLTNQVGYAVLVDGQWKVARETECALLELGGATCP
jgi:hypothetical protein